MIDRIFVYGTLMPGFSRWPGLQPYVTGDPAPMSIKGSLYDSGFGYPAFFLDGEADVPGVVVRLRPDTLDEILAILDEIECTSTGLYSREVVEIEELPSWVYVGSEELRGTPIARWQK